MGAQNPSERDDTHSGTRMDRVDTESRLRETISLKGPCLPTVGGVAVHVTRLAELLHSDGILETVYCTSRDGKLADPSLCIRNVSYPLRYAAVESVAWLVRWGTLDRAAVIHLHGNPVWEVATLHLLLTVLKRRVVYTIHDQMILNNFGAYPAPFRYLMRRVAGRTNIRWIAVSARIRDQLLSVGVSGGNITVIPAFLPSPSDDSPLNRPIEEFVRTRSRVLSVYAHSTREYEGRDLYGIDLALKATAIARKSVPDIGLVVCIPGKVREDTKHVYEKIIEENCLADNVLLFLGAVNNPSNLWKRSDIVLRPTLSDGDSLVVREAVSQGTSVIASDVVDRIDAVTLFKSEDVDDLASKILRILESRGGRDDTPIHPSGAHYDLIREVYADLIES